MLRGECRREALPLSSRFYVLTYLAIAIDSKNTKQFFELLLLVLEQSPANCHKVKSNYLSNWVLNLGKLTF